MSRILFFIIPIILISCATGNRSFQKQKYTNLKSKEGRISQDNIQEDVVEDVYGINSIELPNEEPAESLDKITPEPQDNVPHLEQNEPAVQFAETSEEVIRKRLPELIASKKNSRILREKAENPEGKFAQNIPFVIAWVIYTICSILLLFAAGTGFFGFGVYLLMIGAACMLLIGGLLMTFTVYESKRKNDPTLTAVSISVLVDLLINTILLFALFNSEFQVPFL